MCAKVWCKMLLMMWTSILVLGSVGTLGCCSRAGASWDGCRVSLLEQDLGHPKAMCAKVWSKRRLCGGHQHWFWGPRAPRDGVCEVVHVGMDGVGLLEQAPWDGAHELVPLGDGWSSPSGA